MTNAFLGYSSHLIIILFTSRTFRELKDYIISMKSEKDEASDDGEGEAAPASVAVLDGKNFEETIKTGRLNLPKFTH